MTDQKEYIVSIEGRACRVRRVRDSAEGRLVVLVIEDGEDGDRCGEEWTVRRVDLREDWFEFAGTR